MNYVTREFYDGKWNNTYFKDMRQAKILCRKILKAGGVAICLKTK